MKSGVNSWRQEVVMMEIEHQVFAGNEIDLDYEFDAARFFDFSMQETPTQAHQAERWFEAIGSYPPSPFVANLVLREEDVDAATIHDPKPNVFQHYRSKAVDGTGNISEFQGGVFRNVAMQPEMTFSSSKTIGGGCLNSKAKSAVTRGSTLMKPTASQLAKQNRPPQMVGSRLQRPQPHKEINFSASSATETQATKRQKLEGGLLRKVGDVKQQANFVHKAPKKVVTVDPNSGYSKLKITIPREPGLETAHRAQRIRPKNAADAEIVTVAAPRFKARPLNRKILNAPSLPLPKRSTPRLPEFQEFHLKTSERAMQHTSATPSSTLSCGDSAKVLDKHTTVSAPENRSSDLRRPSVMGAPRHDGLDYAHNFQARPLNKKILSSKGDIGVFRNIKQEATVPVEFNFHTEKRIQHNLPIDLFSKLSLKSEPQSKNGSQSKLPPHFRAFRKDSKENIGSSCHLDQKEKPFIFEAKQVHLGSDGCISQTGTLLSARRSLGIR